MLCGPASRVMPLEKCARRRQLGVAKGMDALEMQARRGSEVNRQSARKSGKPRYSYRTVLPLPCNRGLSLSPRWSDDAVGWNRGGEAGRGK